MNKSDIEELDQQEKDLIEAYEDSEVESIARVREEIKRYQAIAKGQLAMVLVKLSFIDQTV